METHRVASEGGQHACSTPGGKLLSFGSLALMLAGLIAVSRSQAAAGQSIGLAPPASVRQS
ncbi:MAG: hypothetical protein WA484_07655 [Solirubrobacteraceae bacterium]